MAVAAALLITSAPAPAQIKMDANSLQRDQADIQKMQDSWTAAVLRGDSAALQQILGSDFTFVTPEGEMLSKGETVAYFTKDLKIDSLSVQVDRTRIYIGSAVVTSQASLKGTYKDKEINGDYRVVDVFEPERTGWKAVYRQVTKVKSEKDK